MKESVVPTQKSALIRNVNCRISILNFSAASEMQAKLGVGIFSHITDVGKFRKGKGGIRGL